LDSRCSTTAFFDAIAIRRLGRRKACDPIRAVGCQQHEGQNGEAYSAALRRLD
jgi:hypothetical protein